MLLESCTVVPGPAERKPGESARDEEPTKFKKLYTRPDIIIICEGLLRWRFEYCVLVFQVGGVVSVRWKGGIFVLGLLPSSI